VEKIGKLFIKTNRKQKELGEAEKETPPKDF